MWSLVFSGVTELFKSWVDLKKSKNESEAAFNRNLAQTEADWDLQAQKQAQYSWKDEFITLVWFSPLVVAWFYPERAKAWVDFIGSLPYFYQFIMFGIVAASFGLRWYFKQQNFKITKKTNS